MQTEKSGGGSFTDAKLKADFLKTLNEPSLESANRLADALRVSVTYLAGGGEQNAVLGKTPRFFRWGIFL